MNYTKRSYLPALLAIVLLACVPGTASATTFAINGLPQNVKTEFTASLKSGTSMIWKTTEGELRNTCVSAGITGASAFPYTAAKTTASISSLSFPSCLASPNTVHKVGHLYLEYIKGVPGEMNGTVTWEGTEITVQTPIGYMPCQTVGAADVGTLTGVGHYPATAGVKHATLDIRVPLNCSIFAPSIVWEASYTFTSPTGLGVVA